MVKIDEQVYRYWRKRNLSDDNLFDVALFYEDIVKKFYRKGSGKIYVSELVSHNLLSEMKYLTSDFFLLESDKKAGKNYSANVNFIKSVKDLSDLNFVFSFHKTFNLMLERKTVLDYLQNIRKLMTKGGIFVLETELFNAEVFQPYSSSWNYESCEYSLKVKIIDEEMDFFNCTKKQKVIIKKSDGSLLKSHVRYRIYTMAELKEVFQSSGLFEMISIHNPYVIGEMNPDEYNGNVVVMFRAK